MPKIVITGAAGLVGQNLVARLRKLEGWQIVGLDKHPANARIFRTLHPDVTLIEADLSQPGDWQDALAGADTLVINQAQIGGLEQRAFVANNITATENLLAAARAQGISYVVGISSSVVNSHVVDFYTETKKAQEKLVRECGLPHIVLRPTLMFGWFDRKHLGWLRRFMDRTPLFPIPGRGDYIRQPLYVGDFTAILVAAIRARMTGCYDISGLERVTYGNLIRLIHAIVRPRARIVHVPYRVFWLLLWLYARFDRDPPFTTRQLEALVVPEEFPVIDWPEIFGVATTPLRQALEETFCDQRYSSVVLAF